ncbi:MAG: hypothetical protein ACPID2_02670 [Candidatus Puniceispirillum sp.]
MVAELLSKEHVQSEFARFADDIRSSDPQSQLGTVGEMLNMVSNYLNQNISGINTSVILVLLEELNNISNGNEARFIRSKVQGGGRPLDAGKNLRQLSLCAAIHILEGSGIKKRDAIQTVSNLSGISYKKLNNLRADFRKNNKSRDATKLMWKFVSQQTDKSQDPHQQAEALVSTAMKIGE